MIACEKKKCQLPRGRMQLMASLWAGGRAQPLPSQVSHVCRCFLLGIIALAAWCDASICCLGRWPVPDHWWSLPTSARSTLSAQLERRKTFRVGWEGGWWKEGTRQERVECWGPSEAVCYSILFLNLLCKYRPGNGKMMQANKRVKPISALPVCF